MKLTPDYLSPFAMVWKIGEAPLYLGRREGWATMTPFWKDQMSFEGNMYPKEQTMPKSARRSLLVNSYHQAFIFSLSFFYVIGVVTGICFSLQNISTWLKFFVFGGVQFVTTSIFWYLLCRVRKVGNATAPEPKKTILSDASTAKCCFQALTNLITENIIDVNMSLPNDTHSCLRCKDHHNTLFMLGCNHIFCVTCIAFMHIKFKPALHDPQAIKCILCSRISEIGQEVLRLVNENINQVILPFMASEEKEFNTEVKENSLQTEIEMTIQKKVPSSLQQSAEKPTPGNKCFSRGDSPKAAKQDHCLIHSKDELAFVCFTCENQLICLKCVTSKKHQGHAVKSLLKAVQILQDKRSLNRLEIKEEVDRLELWQRRLEERKTHLGQRLKSSKEEIQQSFNALGAKIYAKSQEIISSCEKHFEALFQQIQKEGGRITDQIYHFNSKINRLDSVESISSPSVEVVRKLAQAIKDGTFSKSYNTQMTFFESIPHHSSRVLNQISNLSQIIEGIHLDRKIESTKTLTVRMGNCRSEEYKSKKLKTNMLSLNSSRDRKDKKCTKTEEDERKNRTKVNYKTEAAVNIKPSREIPQYIMQFFEKPGVKALEGGVEQSTLHHSFKSTTKNLSKTQLAGIEQLNLKKRKEQSAVKERVERKTANVTQKQIKRKKVHF